MKVVWSPLAMERVREHAGFIARDNPEAARDWINEVFDAAETLASFPKSGRIVPELNQADVRELIHDGYRIIYRVESEQVSVLTVRHASASSRNVPPARSLYPHSQRGCACIARPQRLTIYPTWLRCGVRARWASKEPRTYI